MRYISTRDITSQYSAAQAITQGLAQDGGLLTPYYIPKLPGKALEDIKAMAYQQRAVYIMKMFLEEFSVKELTDFANAAYGPDKFDSPAVAPVHTVDGNTHCLELWHGPTCAFKDMALQMLPHLLSASLVKTEEEKTACILVATSGDTGKGALEGFKDVPRTKILVFYPKDGVSQVQELQMVTQEGGNVGVAAVVGNFDDAQTGVKKLFSDPAVRKELAGQGYFFSSANSINWGRVLPQLVYYISAYCDLIRDEKITPDQPVNICVPTGNFGNILAAYYALEMGLPIKQLICASNRNNVLTDFLHTGTYDRNRTFYNTMSPSMDILISSNLERLIYLIAGEDSERTKALMAGLKDGGSYGITDDMRQRLADFAAGYATEEETAGCIRSVFEKTGYVMDTHTAVAAHVCGQYRSKSKDTRKCVVASTASPYKFVKSVMTAIDDKYKPEDEFTLLEELRKVSGVDMPQAIRDILNAEVLHTKECDADKMKDIVNGFL